MEKLENSNSANTLIKSNHAISTNSNSKKFLNYKTNRNSHSHSHNKRKNLLHQLEFYFSDINLYNDKFLRNLISKDSDRGVEINIILNFNKIKDICSDIDSDTGRINFIKKAVEHSKKIQVINNKLCRVEPFSLNKMNQKDIDDKIIYVQNIPNDVTHETLYQVFTKYGKVVHISIPKFQNSRQVKGFAFITFDKHEECLLAREQGNNSIPKEFITQNQKGDLDPMYILTKAEWLEKKEEFKKLKQELMNENKDLFAECFGQDSKTITTLTPGTLVKLSNIPANLDKYALKAWISNFVEPAYVDYTGSNSDCVVRFSHKILAESFVKKLNNEEDFKLHGVKINAEMIQGEEEKAYMEKVEKLKEEVKKKRSKSKSKSKTKTNK